MDEKQEKEILNFMIELSKEMNNIALKYFKNLKESDSKSKSETYDDPVTIADIEISKMIIKKIKERFNDEVSILCEETKLNINLEKPIFIIDEIDGTQKYRDGKENFCHLLCYYDKEPLISVIYVPIKNDLYYAIKGKGAFKNNKQIFCSKNKFSNNKAIFSLTSNKNHYEKYSEIIDKFIKLKKTISYNNPDIKGSFGYQGCKLSEGDIDFFFGTRPNIWDIASIYLLTKESGGNCYILRNEKDLFNIKNWNFNDHYKLNQVPILFTNSFVDEDLFESLRD